MPRHPDFEKIYKRFIKTYGEQKGKDLYFAWVSKKGYTDTKPFPRGKEKKEKLCIVRGLEIKEVGDSYHVEGLIATSHIDSLDEEEGIEIPDVIPKETLLSFSKQMNTLERARVMGVHHSEGKPINPEYFGVADVETTPVDVIELSDGEWGLYVDTKLLKDDPETPSVIKQFEDGDLNSFSITYDTHGFTTTDFNWYDDKLVRVIGPKTELCGYTGASAPVNKNTLVSNFGFKEFKELIKKKEVIPMTPQEKEQKELEKKEEEKKKAEEEAKAKEDAEAAEKAAAEKGKEDSPANGETAEQKEFRAWKTNRNALEQKEAMKKVASEAFEEGMKKFEVKEKVLKKKGDDVEIPLEIKEFRELTDSKASLELKEQFRRASAFADKIGMDCMTKITIPVESREYKSFGVNGRHLEYKGLGLTTNQNTDTDYLQSTAELQDVYDPVIYNALNQKTVTWNILAKDDFSKKGNNQIQFVLKTAANTSAAFYTGNSVSTGNVGRLKYQTKFKKLQVGVSVDGDMIAAARGGPVSDVFAQEVLDSTMDMLAVLNAGLYGVSGAETDAGIIGFEYITDSATYTTLYNLTRSTTNKLAPDAAGDTFINQSSGVISMGNLRKLKRQAVTEGVMKDTLCYFCNATQADMLRGKFDDSRRMLTMRDSGFGFSTDLWVDGIPVFEDKDANEDDWFCVDLDTHRVGIWIPPTIERLGKSADSEDAFIKCYLGTYNRRPRAMGQVYGCATS